MTNRHSVRSDPFFSELLDFRRSFDNLVNQMFALPAGSNDLTPTLSSGLPTWTPELESYIEKGKLFLRFNLAGIDPSEVRVDLHGNQLTVQGERKPTPAFQTSSSTSYSTSGSSSETTPPGLSRPESTHPTYLHREFTLGHFERTVNLPEGVKVEQIEANYSNGVLTLTAPLSEKSIPRSIEVKIGPSRSTAIPPTTTSKTHAA